MVSILDAVLILGSHNTEQQAREILSASQCTDADRLELIQLGGESDVFSRLPVSHVTVFQGTSFFTPETAATILQTWLGSRKNSVLFYGDCYGHALSVRLGWLAGSIPFTHVIGISNGKECLRIRRRVYGLRLEGSFVAPRAGNFLSIERDSFPPMIGYGSPEIHVIQAEGGASWYSERASVPFHPEVGLKDRHIILVGGRGLGSKANAQKLIHLAQLMSAGIGATRPAVQCGWFEEQQLIGSSGVQVAPELCITFGVSGCAALLLGIRHSHRILAINTDSQAPIFHACTDGLIADCVQVIEALTAYYEKIEEK